MPSLWSVLRGQPPDEKRYGLSQWANEYFQFGGGRYPLFGAQQTSTKREVLEHDFLGYVRGLYKSNGVVFACMVARMQVFSEARFAWQTLEDGRPADIRVDGRLRILERPWPGAGTGELLSRCIQDADLAGNAYWVKDARDNRLRRLRPDWVEIILSVEPDKAVRSDIVGYAYYPGGRQSGSRAKIYLAKSVAHWAPIPDPEASYRGMSWLQPVVDEVISDKGATLHKKKFFENAATPNISVALKETVTREQFSEFMQEMERHHGHGVHDAYKTLYLGGGADVKVIGADLRQLDFKATQGAGETRIAAAARVHPVIVGLSEGMQGSSLNAGNFKAAKDAFADGTLRPLWRSVCQAFDVLLETPRNHRLWYDDRDIAFLRADQIERAEVQQREANVIRALTDGGFKPESIVKAVRAHDWTMLEHSGLVSVQLLPPGTTGSPPGEGSGGGSGGGSQPGRRPGGAGPAKNDTTISSPKPSSSEGGSGAQS